MITARMELEWLRARYDGGPYPPGIWDRIQTLLRAIGRGEK